MSCQNTNIHQTKGSVMYSLSPWTLVALCMVTLSVHANPAKPNDTDTRFRAIYTTEWKWRNDQFPDDEDSSKPIQDHLPKMDPASQAMRLRTWQDVLQKLDSISRADLSPAEQLN